MINLLLMTATISPPYDAVKLARMDPNLRRQDYISAFEFYLGCLERGELDFIVFCENSNSDISSLKRVADLSPFRASIEFIVFDGIDYPSKYGRAYGELKLIDYAMRNSSIISQAAPNSIIWKVTGRYIISNIYKIISDNADPILFCHCRNYPSKWIEMYFIGWKKDAYEKIFRGVADAVRESEIGASSEVAFRKIIDKLKVDFNVRMRFSEAPSVRGVRGVDGERYEKQYFKKMLRKFLGWAFPWIWI